MGGMRLARHGAPGNEQPIAAGADDEWHDLRPLTDDITAAFIGSAIGAGAPTLDLAALPVVTDIQRFGPPIADVGKVVCIGLNYVAHARETGADQPKEPIVFLKTPDTIVGPHDQVMIPRGSVKTDWEVELAIVIGAPARYLDSPEDAPACIAGYAISNDVSEREFQLERGGQWDKGKNCETFNPLGPWVTTADAVPDPQALDLRLWVNDELRQDSNTSDMIFGINHIVWYLSQFMVLRPGDIINTGTPQGVAMGRPDKPYLRAGDVVELEIELLGRQRQSVVQG
jgi:2-keto-4-pentenoate hydratase/2-oxohepta-3-ene-1,7-dioic acid hydratase in catechol pathway